MPDIYRMCVLALALGFLGCAHHPEPARPAAPRPWAHENSDLKPDPAVVWGRLENGLRYAILPHATPRQRASVFLLVQAGSYYENGNELGYAHFVEHMAFRDLRGIPAGVFATLEKLGADSSPHSNGTTSFFETEYRFDHLPVEDPESLAIGLKLLRAIADGIIFEPKAVERERGVIFNEQRSRDGMLARTRPDELDYLPPIDTELRFIEVGALFGNTRLPRRSALGADKTLHAATAMKLRAFYERWYRPERMVLTIAGDVAPAAAEELVRRSFSTLAAKGRAQVQPAVEKPDRRGTLSGSINPRANEPLTRVALCAASPVVGPDSSGRRRQSLLRRIALAMLDRRYERAAHGTDAPFVSAGSVLSHSIPGLELVLLRAGASPSLWLRAMVALDYEVRRAREKGFAAAELDRAVKAETIRVAAAARQAGQRPSSELAQALAFAIARDVVFTAAAADRDLTAAQLATITEPQCQAALRELLPPGKSFLAATGPFPDGPPKFRAVVAALNASRAEALTPYAPPAPPRPFPYTDFGPAGQVVKREHVAAYDADLLLFANGVRLTLKRTGFEPGRVRFLIRVDGGRLANPPDQPGFDLRMLAWPFGGLRDLSEEELTAALSDLTDSPSFNVSGSDFRLSQAGDASHLLLLLQVAAAYFVHPAFREEKRGAEFARQVIASYSVTASGVAESSLRRRLTGDHPVMRLAHAGQVAGLTLEELKTWLLPQLAHAPMEISLIGDFDPAAAIEAVARTFGALPPRSMIDPFAEQRRIAFPPAPFSESITFDGNPGVAAVALAWPVPNLSNFPARFRAHLVAAILQQRLWQKLRVEMGETYALGASLVNDDAFRPSLDFVHCRIEGPPDRIEQVAAIAREVAGALGRDGATPDELERARRPRVRDTESGLRRDEWLLDVISVAQSNPAYALGWAGALAEYQAATLDEINALARTCLANERPCQLIARPK